MYCFTVLAALKSFWIRFVKRLRRTIIAVAFKQETGGPKRDNIRRGDGDRYEYDPARNRIKKQH